MRINPDPIPFDPSIPHGGPISPHLSVNKSAEGVVIGVRGSVVTIPAGMAIEFASLIAKIAGEFHA